MKHETYLTTTFYQTKGLAEKLAKEILKLGSRQKAIVLALEGDLGGGKTTFLQGFAKGLGIKEKILSPTFVLMKRFKIPFRVVSRSARPAPNERSEFWCGVSLSFAIFYHFDCYRIQKPKELISLGYKKIIKNPQNIVAVEWANRVRKIIPKSAVWLKFVFIDNKTRKITIKT